MSARIPQIDGLRAIAMTMVVAQHCGLLPFGWVGVWLFFVISGYVITRGFMADDGRFASPGEHLRDFMLRRAVRIIPVYLAYVAVNVAILATINGVGRLGDVPWLLSFTYNWHMVFGFPPGSSNWGPFGHLWTLSVEEQFYVFFPLLALFVPRASRVPVTLAIIVAGPLIRYVYGAMALGHDGDPGWRAFSVYAASVCHVDAFLLGSLLARFENRPEVIARWHRPLLTLAVAVFAVYCAVYVGINIADGKRGSEALRNVISGNMYGQYRELFVYTTINLVAATVLMHAIRAGRGVVWLGHRWLASVGQVSYGGYLFHALLLWVVGATFLPGGQFDLPIPLRILKFLLVLPATIWLAQLSFRYFEVPVRVWLLARWRATPAPRSSVSVASLNNGVGR